MSDLRPGTVPASVSGILTLFMEFLTQPSDAILALENPSSVTDANVSYGTSTSDMLSVL